MLEAVLKMHLIINTDGNYMFKVNNRNIRTSYGMCSKLTIKKLEKNLKKYCISSQKDSIINVWKRQKKRYCNTFHGLSFTRSKTDSAWFHFYNFQ